MPFLSTYIDARTVIFYHLLNPVSQFKFPARQPYARLLFIKKIAEGEDEKTLKLAKENVYSLF